LNLTIAQHFLLGSLVVLFPIAIYCLLLARINRRTRPLIVPGIWDSAGLILALSGVLFFLGPSVLTGFNYRFRDIWLFNRYSSPGGLGPDWRWLWWAFIWLSYAVVVLGGCAWMMWRRRTVTCIYNVEPEVVDEILARILDRLGLEWVRNADRIFMRVGSAYAEEGPHPLPAPHQVPQTAHALLSTASPSDGVSQRSRLITKPQKPAVSLSYPVALEVCAWPAMHHVTLRWLGRSESWRKTVDDALARSLARAVTRRNSAGHWLMVASAILFPLLFILTVLFQIIRLYGNVL
jgi:hypothetical protein